MDPGSRAWALSKSGFPCFTPANDRQRTPRFDRTEYPPVPGVATGRTICAAAPQMRPSVRRVIAKCGLQPHATSPASAIEHVGCKLSRGHRGSWCLEYVVGGDIDRLTLPSATRTERADGLWQTTCFELFIRPMAGDGYFEFNFAPSGRWAAYRFDSYRAGMRDAVGVFPPVVERMTDPVRFAMEVTIDLSTLPAAPWRLAPTAVIEEIDGTKSYWALAHPPGKPDFHDPACFALELPAPDAA